MATLKRIKPRQWLGNGMGYDPATYAIVTDRTGVTVGKVEFYAGRWNVTRFIENTAQIKHRFDTFKAARDFAKDRF